MPTRLTTRSRPRIFADFAMTLDGKLLLRNSASPFSTPSEQFFPKNHAIAPKSVLLGKTGLARLAEKISDHPPPHGSPNHTTCIPCLVICLPDGILPVKCENIITITDQCIVFSTEQMPKARRDQITRFQQIKLELLPVYSLATILAMLHENFSIDSLLCTDDPDCLQALLEIDAIDELFLTLLPQISGDENRSSLTGLSPNFLPQSLVFEVFEMKTLDNHIALHYHRCLEVQKTSPSQ